MDLEVPLKSAMANNADLNVISNAGTKKDRQFVVSGWNNKNHGYNSKNNNYVTFVFEDTVGYNDKWAFINTAIVLDQYANFYVLYNGAYRFRNASSSEKFINIYVDAYSLTLK